MIRLLLTRVIPSGAMSGAVIHHVLMADSGESSDKQLLAGLITTLGLIAVAAITGYFGLLVARSRAPQVVSSVDHDRVARAAEEANSMLVLELARKEEALQSQNAQLAARDALLAARETRITEQDVRINEQAALIEQLRRPPPRRRRAPNEG